jgi:hypothetical protein
MPNQFVVPQFIDAEDTIIGPVTVRQFVIMLIAGLIATLSYRLFDFSLFLLISVPLVIFAGVLAFMKVNGVSIHFFILNVIQTMRRPKLRVWDKTPTNQLLYERMKSDEEVKAQVFVRKPMISKSRMQDLSLIVNTGGVFNPEENNLYE